MKCRVRMVLADFDDRGGCGSSRRRNHDRESGQRYGTCSREDRRNHSKRNENRCKEVKKTGEATDHAAVETGREVKKGAKKVGHEIKKVATTTSDPPK